MLISPEFPDNPLDLIKTLKNKNFAEYLQREGMKPSKVGEILKAFFDFRIMLRDVENHASNPEWVRRRIYRKKIAAQYEKALGNLKKLMDDELIPLETRNTIIKRDIDSLQNVRDFVSLSYLKTANSPAPTSTQQMINMQASALFQYFKKVTCKKRVLDKAIYGFITELLKNLYADTALRDDMKKLSAESLKKNFIDNTDKLTAKKYEELQRKITLIIS